MFSLTASDRFYLYPYPTDMRKSFYTLSGIVTNQMGMDVQDGDAFVFINKGYSVNNKKSHDCVLLLMRFLLETFCFSLFSSSFYPSFPLLDDFSFKTA